MAEYLNNEEFLNLIKNYKKTKDKKLYEKLGKAFKAIVTNLLYRPNFVNYTQDLKDDMVSDACFFMVKYFDRFDENKSENPFAYFTMIAWRAIIQNIKKFKEYQELFVSINFIEYLDESDELNEKYVNAFKVEVDFIEREIKRLTLMGIEI